MPLPPGTKAPDFELPSTPDQTVSLADFRGQPVILAFYPEDWSPVCSDQMAMDGTSERALYVIDRDGIVHWSYVSPVGVNPGADGILRALESLQ
jgi:peroxiredoxin